MTDAILPSFHAFGKVILLGEHAVVYGFPALCTALTRGVRIAVQPGTGCVRIPAWDMQTPPANTLLSQSTPSLPLHQAYRALLQALQHVKSICFSSVKHDYVVHFDIPVGAGLGSSAAWAVALTRALAWEFHVSLSAQQLHEVAQAAEQIIHGQSSGLDALLAAQSGFGRFAKQSGLHALIPKPFSLCLAWTRQPKDTRTQVEKIKKQLELQPNQTWAHLQQIGRWVEEGCAAVQTGDWNTLGNLMNHNQEMLSTLGVSSPEIDRACQGALQAGALGAKLTGAGGGGCVIALAPGKEEQVQKSWQQAGFFAFVEKIGWASQGESLIP